MKYQLNISGVHYEQLFKHLFPGDKKEAVAIALCGRMRNENCIKLMISELFLIPYTDCEIREEDQLKWNTKILQPLLEKANLKNLSILKIHSHPTGHKNFSRQDNKSDSELFSSAFGWIDDEGPHCSAVMLPTGEIFGRFFFNNMQTAKIERILIVGDTVKIFPDPVDISVNENGIRTAQTFGDRTYQILKELKVGVVGCSGTGSIIIEQLVRLGVGEIVIADPDRIEYKNLNRILHSKLEHAKAKLFKVDVLAEAISNIGFGTKVKPFAYNIYENKKLRQELAECDFVFGCMDSVDGRHLLNQLAVYYLIPYIDVGVKLEADRKGGISKICGSAHYVQPGKSSLLSRRLYNIEDLRASGQLRKNPEEYKHLLKNSYIKNINVDRPAVISVNAVISSIGINEFLNRIHPFKSQQPKYYSTTTFDLSENYIVSICEDDHCVDEYLVKMVGRGDVTQFLNMPELS